VAYWGLLRIRWWIILFCSDLVGHGDHTEDTVKMKEEPIKVIPEKAVG
jgi:hypothetical protein